MPTTVGSNPSTAFAGAGFEPNPTTAGRLNSNAWATTGWSDGDLAFGGTRTTAGTDYTRGSTTGSVTTGGIYAFTGVPGSVANPTLMIQPGGNDFTPGTITLRIQNNGISAITDLAVSYNLYVNNDEIRGNSFNFSYSTDNVTYTPVAALDYTSIEAVDALGWVLVGTAPSRSTNITGLSVAPSSFIYLRWSGDDVLGSSGARDEFGLDDIVATATYGSTNTIVIDNINTPPFVLANCTSTATGTVDITSTGTFNAGNIYTVQLSDDVGSFTAPVNIGSIVSVNNTESINFTIPAGTAGGTGYKMRVVSSDPAVTGTESAAFTITQNGLGGCSSSHTDYYRSVTTGDWTDPNTWESSPDNTNWITATLAPTYLANTILIRATHTVTIDGLSSADQLTIQSGGVLNHSNGSPFTLNDGTGTDMTIENGGTYVLNGTQPTAVSTATVDVQSGATVRVDDNSFPNESDDFAFGANATVTFNTGCTYEWNTIIVPSWTGRTYFTSGQNTKFKFSTAPGGGLGGNNDTFILGHLDLATGINLSFVNTGIKYIRYGIIGDGTINASTAGSGAVVIDGATSELGGGSLTLQTGVPLQMTNTTCTMVAPKIITGDVTFSGTTNIFLGNNDLTVSGSIAGYGTSSYVHTNGTGYLKMNTIGGTRVFPVGASSFNALYVNNGSNADYSVRVEDGINPVIAFPTYGINRTWNVYSSTPTTGVQLSFQYAAADANPGATPQPQPMEILMYSGSAWSITTGNSSINPTGADPTLLVSSVIPTGDLSIGTASTPFALGISGGFILPVNCVVALKAQKRNNSGIISWTASSCTEVESFELQRSVNGAAFETIHTIRPSSSATDFIYTDAQLARGRNLYRVKISGFNGDKKYSGTVALIDGSNDLFISSLAPNPTSGISRLTISAGKVSPVSFAIYNAGGTVVKRWTTVVGEGSTTVDIDVAGLAAGVYNVIAVSGDSKSVLKLVKQ